ncbi:MAG: protein kinase [Anaerolineales bacterium]|nr:protein kinase [Anaerolineales bacterium]
MAASETINNRFVIHDLQRDLLGRGGMGAVYRGLDTLTGETVAIKALNPDLVTANPETVARFRREAEALRQLNHPNIVSMLAAVEEDGRHYLVVEYVDGGNLRQLLDREPTLPIQRVMQIGLELADALSRTHHLRIIHRDLKPANVLLTAGGTPKLTDFGVASMADSAYLTQTGMWVGTPHYLSPEACNGEKLDARADIWAFGVLLYEMLAGRVPFAGDTLMATLTAIFRHPLPDLSTMRQDVPEPLMNLVQHMLVKERDRRIGSMRLVAAELEALLRGKPSPMQLGPLQVSEPVDLTTLTGLEFEAMVGDALKRYREGDWLALADSPLARSPLVEPYFLPGEPVTAESRAQALEVMLRWGIEKLNPGGQHSWLGSSWRHYNILYHFYVEGERANDLAELMAIASQTFYSNWRPQAIAAVSRVLQEELGSGKEAADRQRFAIAERYRRGSADEQQMLRLLAIFSAEAYVPVDWLARLLPKVEVLPVLLRLVDGHLVQGNERLTAVRLQGGIYSYLMPFSPLAERRRWHDAAGTLYLEAQAYLEAARHFRQAGAYEKAARILVQQRQAIFDQMQVEALGALVAQFQVAELADAPNVWAQVKIVAGRVAEYLEDMETAAAEYGEALAAPDVTTKVEAYFARAKVLQRLNIDESLAHFGYCIDLVERQLLANYEKPDEKLMRLLTRLYIDRAWIFIQERPEWARAESDLARSQEIMRVVASDDRAGWANLYQAWAGLAYQRGEFDRAIKHRLQAWLAASETKDVDLMVRTAYNLGKDYIWAKRYTQGIDYLHKSYDLAQKAGNQQMRGMSQKGLGNGYFFQGDYGRAIEHYERAYRIFQDAKNLSWRASMCYDLAEVHAEVGDIGQAQAYYQEGVAMATEIGQDRYLSAFESLREKYPFLALALNERQNRALAYVKLNDELTMQVYIELTEISRSQAHRDLQELVDQGILLRVGKGRGTRYVLGGDPPP